MAVTAKTALHTRRMSFAATAVAIPTPSAGASLRRAGALGAVASKVPDGNHGDNLKPTRFSVAVSAVVLAEVDAFASKRALSRDRAAAMLIQRGLRK